METIKTACGICGLGCGLNVIVGPDGRIEKVEGMTEHPLNKGMICARARNAASMIYHPDRIKSPLRKEGNGFKRISWDEALDTVAANLSKVKEKYGPTALAVCFGQPILTQGSATITFVRRFCDAYGTPSVFSVDSMCWRAFIIGDILTLGKYGLPDPKNARCILVWGTNPSDSQPFLARDILQLKQKGTRLIVIDPRRTALAKKADIYVAPRPGTDLALMLGLLNVIISEGLYDKDFVVKWALGFDKLTEHIKAYAPEKVEELTGVPAQQIRQIARDFATIKPACIATYSNTLEEQGSGVQLSRARCILQAITGNFEVPGGFITTSSIRHKPVRLENLLKHKPLGVDKYPLFYGVWGKLIGEGEGQSMLLPDAILHGKPYPVRAAIVSGSNLALTWPNSRKVTEALQSLDFLVAMDLFPTRTTEMAHIVLPAASCFERNVIFDFYRMLHGLPFVMLQKKIVTYEESRSDMTFYLELAKRMGYGEYFPWQTADEAIDYIFEPSGLSIEKLSKQDPGGVTYGTVKLREYETRGFPTPSGKMEVYSKTLEELGHDPLPTYREPQPAAGGNGGSYPLIMVTGSRKLPFCHSQLRQVARLRKILPEHAVEIHPETASKYNIENGKSAILETKNGRITVKALVTEDILPGVLSATHGWADANINLLTDNAPVDPISGFPRLKGVPCRIARAN
ncbi:MAG: molybdopterin-dependent oxidoreductase [Chloroflexi bacterium]|nr:molybdopterin-dependent oxidoreductase [Chloroflexota bacterium]